MNSYTIFCEGAETGIVIVGYSEDDALNTFADQMEQRDVPAFYHRDGDIPYILAEGIRYFARPIEER